MPRPGHRSRLPRALLLGLLVTVVLGLLPAGADTGAVVIAARGQYLPGDDRNVVPVVVSQGFDLLFENFDLFSFGGHTLTSDTPGLFDSGVVEIRRSTTISLSTVPPGTYGFYCTVHLEMHGTLVIV